MTKLELFVIEKIKEKRNELGYTAQDLGEATGNSQNFINNIESNKSTDKYNITHLSKIAELFNCYIQDFFPLDKKNIFEKNDKIQLSTRIDRINLRKANKKNKK